MALTAPHSSEKPSSSGLATIAAIATPLGRGGVGVIRLSGARAYDIACILTGKSAFTPRMASFCRFYQADGTVLMKDWYCILKVRTRSLAKMSSSCKGTVA